MLLNEFLTLASRAVYLLIAVITLTQFALRRDRTRLDVALMFLSLAVAGLVDTLQEFTGVRSAWMGAVNDLAFLAQPYLLVRMVSQFRPVPRRVQGLTLAGMLAAWAAALFGNQAGVVPLGLVMGAYFVAAEAYAVAAFVRLARGTRGVTRARNQLAATGAGLVVSVIVFALAGGLVPALAPASLLMTQILGLASGVAWYLAFASPGWLRHYWQLRELQRFLRAQTAQSAEARATEALPLLCEMAVRATGARAAAVALWEPAQARLAVRATTEPALANLPLEPEASVGPLRQAWRDWQPTAQSQLSAASDGSRQWVEAVKAEVAYAVPVGPPERRRGLLVVLLQHAPLFVNDDLALLALLCAQADLALEQWELFEVQERMLRRELVEAATAAERERLRVTLTSIGDAVIATDTAGQLTFMNAVAEALTGWSSAEAIGQPVAQVFDIVNEQTRRHVDNPVARVLRDGTITGLANHTVLLRRGGGEVPIDDSGAPIYDDAGRLLGVVLIFRDVTARRQAEATHTFLATLIEASEDAIVGASLAGNIVSWNPGAERLYGYPAKAMVGQPLARLAPPHAATAWPALLERVQRGEAVRASEAEHQRQDGRALTVALSLSPIRGMDGEVTGASIIARDVTRERQAQERLARLQSVTATLGRAFTPNEVARVMVEEVVPAVRADAGAVVRADEAGPLALAASSGYSASTAPDWPTLLAPDGPVAEVVRNGAATYLEDLRVAGGQAPEAEPTASLLGDPARALVPLAAAGECLAVLVLSYWQPHRLGPDDRAFLQALADQGGQALARARVYAEARALAAELEQRVQARTAELQTLMARLQSVREEERARMAREIHDELGGTLSALKMDLAQMSRVVPSDERAQERLEQLARDLDHAVQLVRRIASDLRPGVLDDFGLVAAMDWQLQEFRRRSGLAIHFDAELEYVELDPDRATAVFRIFQEALTNVGRHAQATRVNVRVEPAGDDLVVQVADNGNGIAPESLLGRQSLGLASMRERARLLGAELRITRNDGGGTTVHLQVPLSDPAAGTPDAA